MTTRLLHLSDLHFGAEDPRAVRALLALAEQLCPDLVVVTGDLTQRARPAEFDAFRAFRVRMPPAAWLVVPGNHDLPWWPLGARLRQPYRRFLEATGQRHTEADLRVGPVRVLAVDSTRWWRHQYGVVSRAQVDRVVDELSTDAHAPWTLVACHHPLRLVPAPLNPRPDRWDLAWGHRGALARWGAARLDGVLCGHVHIEAVLAADGQPVQDRQLPASGAEPWCLQAGSATSWRLPRGQPNSVALLAFDGGLDRDALRHLTITRFDLPRTASRFEAGRVTTVTTVVQAPPAAAMAGVPVPV